jgi:hypothetical protein
MWRSGRQPALMHIVFASEATRSSVLRLSPPSKGQQVSTLFGSAFFPGSNVRFADFVTELR